MFPPLILAQILINAGGPAVLDTGKMFSADRYYSGGTAYLGSVPAGVSAYYATQRYGNFFYAVPVPPGNYDVSLHFYELTLSVNAPGKRRFTVNVNGIDVLTNYDIWAVSNGRGPVAETFRVTAASEVRIQLTTGVRNAALNAFEIRRVPEPIAPVPPLPERTERLETHKITGSGPLTFKPAHSLARGSILHVYRNGLLQTIAEDYTLALDNTVSFLPALSALDIVTLNYWSAPP